MQAAGAGQAGAHESVQQRRGRQQRRARRQPASAELGDRMSIDSNAPTNKALTTISFENRFMEISPIKVKSLQGVGTRYADPSGKRGSIAGL